MLRVIEGMFLERADLARLFGVNYMTIVKWQKKGILPPPIRVGNIYRWKISDIAQLLERSIENNQKKEC